MARDEYDERIAMVSTYQPPAPRRRKSPWPTIILGLFTAVIIPPLTLVAIELIALQDRKLPVIHQLADFQPLARTQLFASNGDLIATTGGAPRLLTPAANVPAALTNAIVERVEPAFLTREPLGQKELVHAIDNRIRGREAPLPLSVQLAESLDDDALGTERGFFRSMKDFLVALRLEHDLTRAEILQIYVNQRTFGGGGFGVELGARGHFGRPLAQLDNKELGKLASFDTGEIGTPPKETTSHAAECGQAAVRELATKIPKETLDRLGANVTTTCDLATIAATMDSIDKRHLDKLGLSASVAVMRLPSREVVSLVGAPDKTHPIGILRAPFVIGSALDSLKWTAISPVAGMALRTFVGRSPAGAADALLAVDLPHGPIADIATRAGFSGGDDMFNGKAPVTALQAADLLGTLAMQGERQQPQLVVTVAKPGAKPEPLKVSTKLQAFTPEVASLMTAFLSRPVRSSLNRASAGLTGTEGTDTWLGVYLPNLAVAVWLGPAVGDVELPKGNAAASRGAMEKVAVQVALDVIAVELKDKPALPFTRAGKLFARRVDDKGNLVPRGTPGGTEEWFIPGSARREESELAPDPSQDADPPQKPSP